LGCAARRKLSDPTPPRSVRGRPLRTSGSPKKEPVSSRLYVHLARVFANVPELMNIRQRWDSYMTLQVESIDDIARSQLEVIRQTETHPEGEKLLAELRKRKLISAR